MNNDPGFVHSEVTGLNTAKFLQVEDPNYIKPKTVLTTASTFPDPNRFDPYEALDTILEAMLRGVMATPSDVAVVASRIDALRAYITGMER